MNIHTYTYQYSLGFQELGHIPLPNPIKHKDQGDKKTTPAAKERVRSWDRSRTFQLAIDYFDFLWEIKDEAKKQC